MKNLTDNEKKLFEKKATSITDNDEIRIKKQAAIEIDKLKKIALGSKKSAKFLELIENAQLFYDISNTDKFHLPISSRKWIAFGLDYLISPYDLIPDAIPGIGYSDDALVLSWVKYLVNKDFERYKAYLEALKSQETGGFIKPLKDGKNNHEIIIISGILCKANDPNYTSIWLKQIESIYPESSISIFHWNHIKTIEMEEDIRNLDHELSLKISYDTDALKLDWDDAKQHTEIYSKTFLKDLEDLVKINKSNKVSIFCHSLGTHLFVNCLNEIREGLVDEVYFMAGATNNRKTILKNSHKINKIINLYIENDYVLRFLFENFEKDDKPIGISPITKEYIKNIFDIDCSKKITRHSDYKEKLAELL
ncbi:MAG: DUF726 domain-containing protein [Saprospiraceae bacterium]|nr:DUF726 domain-containing protein [Saprospiraceae bacterium]